MKDKIVIWGIGKLYQGMKPCISLDNVECFVDSDINKVGEIIDGKEIRSPEILAELKYDKIVIFTSKSFEEIFVYITEKLNIGSEKIIHWSDYYNLYNMQQTFNVIIDDAYEKGYEKLLDIGNNFLINHIYMYSYKYCKISTEMIKIIGCESKDTPWYPIYMNLYYQHYNGIDAALKDNRIAAAFLGNIFSQISIESFQKEVQQLMTKFKAVYFTLPYCDTVESQKWINTIQTPAGQCSEWKLQCEKLFCVSSSITNKQIKIYIAAHKAFTPPSNDIYETLWLGKSEDNLWKYQEDKEAPEISYLNPLINECTGLYWIWKHVHCDYIGLVHYRRYFLNDGNENIDNILGKESIEKILQNYDIITAPLINLSFSVSKQLQTTIDPLAFQKGIELIKAIIEEKHPEFIDVFQYVFEGSSFFPCNMFVTRKDVLDKYCEWLFSIIIDAAKQIDVSDYDAYSKRVIGFFAERLFTVWLVSQNLRIKEMPIMLTE